MHEDMCMSARACLTDFASDPSVRLARLGPLGSLTVRFLVISNISLQLYRYTDICIDA